MTRTAIELGSERVANIVALGALGALPDLCDARDLERAVQAQTPRAFLDLNMDALAAGSRLARQAGVAAAA